MKAVKWIAQALLCVICVVFLSHCAAVQEGLDTLTAGKITESDKKAIVKTTKALRKSFAEITEKEEYYIGRAVSALILSRYPVYSSDVLTRYINYVGNAVAYSSDRPETYAGYHFLILDTEEVNALAAPGGFIFITKGLLKRCRDEEMLASILAHEVGHVCAKHGLQSIKKSRLIDAFRIIGQEAAQKYGSEKLAQLTEVFEDVLGDIVEKLIERGYDRKYEYEADKLSIKYASGIGYNPNGLLDFLQTMEVDASSGTSKGWFKTHPSAAERRVKVNKEISALRSVAKKEAVRTQRFNQYIRGLT